MRNTSIAVALLALAPLAASAMSYVTPSNVAIACTVAQIGESAILADETLANQIANKTVVRTGTTATIQNVTPALCAQLQQIAALAAAAQAAKTPTVVVPGTAPGATPVP